MANKSNRRQFLQTTAAATVLSTARGAPVHSKSNSIYLDKLGLQPVINGVGTVTVLGGSIMPPEVVQAMVEASKHFIQLPELQKKVGNVSQSCSRFRQPWFLAGQLQPSRSLPLPVSSVAILQSSASCPTRPG